MSLQIIATITCEFCRQVISGDPVDASSKVLRSYLSAKRAIEKAGWQSKKNGGKPNIHICPGCQDPMVQEMWKAKNLSDDPLVREIHDAQQMDNDK